MPVERSGRRLSSGRIASLARVLLDRSTLFALATVSPGGRAHINAAYFAWDRTFAIVWLSAPGARHSRNLQRNASAAIVVYDSTQRWGRPDRGIHLYGSVRELRGTQRARPHASINDASRTTTSPTSTHTTPGT